MRAAFSVWNDRISPVFDTSRRFLVLDQEKGTVLGRSEEEFPDLDPFRKPAKLLEKKVQVLVCGAISRPLQEMLTAQGIRVIPFVMGDLETVIEAWLKDGLKDDAFLMPGCCGRGRRRGLMAGAGMGQAGTGVRGTGRGGMGRGGGGGRGGGKCGFPPARSPAGAGGFCVCPQCGYREAHQRGVPCVQRQCPRCGTAMTRG